MNEVITRLVDVPIARMFVLAGIIFLVIAVLGKVEGKIDPGHVGRVGASVLGVVLMIIGVAMQYIEVREAALERIAMHQAQNKSQTVVDSALPKQSAVAATDRPAIKVVSGTYGRNCSAKPGNATATLARACDGRNSCDFAVDPDAIDGEVPGCNNKDFAAEWKCGSSNSVYSASLPAEALKNEKLHLACAG